MTINAVDHEAWLAARRALLAKEKELARLSDELAEARRALPATLVEKDYVFESVDGPVSLLDLFGDHSQLIVQHFMFGPEADEGCPICSFWADGYDGVIAHIQQRDTAFVAVSSAPLQEIETFEQKMGWSFDWVSAEGSDFNQDFQVTFTDEQMAAGLMHYNYRQTSFPAQEAPGISIFCKGEDGSVYHTYSCYSRGLDMMNVTYQYLDLLPKGRAEDALPHPMAWVRRRNEYEG